MKWKITITIDAEWGSDFQQQFMEKMLGVWMRAWKDYGDGSHKSNKIIYEIDTNDGYKSTQH